jgi:hypothetical protein
VLAQSAAVNLSAGHEHVGPSTGPNHYSPVYCLPDLFAVCLEGLLIICAHKQHPATVWFGGMAFLSHGADRQHPATVWFGGMAFLTHGAATVLAQWLSRCKMLQCSWFIHLCMDVLRNV